MTTKLQSEMIVAIAECLYTTVNGARPKTKEETYTWRDQHVDNAQSKGVFTSLMNAGLAFSEHEGSDGIIGLTDAGFAEYNKIKDAPVEVGV